jgi:cobalt-zinc-cadmium efflux system outer membrane protein
VANFERLLTDDVRTVFYELLAGQGALRVAEDAARLAEQFFRTTEVRVREGDAAGLELDLARVEFSRALVGRTRARAAIETAQARLNTLIGSPPAQEVRAHGDFSPLPRDFPLDQLIGVALAQRPDLRALEHQQQAADRAVRLARAESVPNITVGLDLTRQRSVFEGTDVRPRGTFDRLFDTDPLIDLRVSVPLPLFHRNQGNIASSLAEQAAASYRLTFQLEIVKRDVVAAYRALRAQQAARELFETGMLPQATLNLDTLREAYTLGAQSVFAVIQAQRTFAEVNREYIDTLLAFQQAVNALEAAIGRRLADLEPVVQPDSSQLSRRSNRGPVVAPVANRQQER